MITGGDEEASALVYNDYIRQEIKERENYDELSDGQFYAQIFFELANVKRVGYRVKGDIVWVEQDLKANDTTGGIVWESGYLLAEYLSQISRDWFDLLEGQPCRMSVIDLGAGGGMLGLTLSCQGLYDVTVTEYYDYMESRPDQKVPRGVFDLLQRNVESFNSTQFGSSTSHDDRKVRVRRLDWTRYLEDISSWEPLLPPEAALHDVSIYRQYDLVVGTDVVFTPSLVRPLLATAAALTKPTGRCIICMQLRCIVSNDLFLELVKEYFECAVNISETVYNTPGCDWGRYMECFVYEMKGPICPKDIEEKMAVVSPSIFSLSPPDSIKSDGIICISGDDTNICRKVTTKRSNTSDADICSGSSSCSRKKKRDDKRIRRCGSDCSVKNDSENLSRQKNK